MTVFGIDIYRYQDVRDWQAVARHTIVAADGARHRVEFAWRKLTDGGGRAVSPGDDQVRGLKSIGVAVGGYHYAQLSPTPERQADVLLAEIERLDATGLVPMLDIEHPFTPDTTAREFGERFCRRIAAHGYRPGVYMSDSFARVLRPDKWDTDPVLWIARYGAKPAYGGPVDVHQYSSTGRVGGIVGDVDLNWAYSTRHFTNGDDMAGIDYGRVNEEAYRGVSNLWFDAANPKTHAHKRLADLRKVLGLDKLDTILARLGDHDAATREAHATAVQTIAAELRPVLRDVLDETQAEEIAERVLDGLADRLAAAGAQ